jgi:hemoglobin
MGRSVFEAAGGSGAMLALAGAWHERCLADPVVSHAFEHGHHPDHTARLAAYWGRALGGPADQPGLADDVVLRMHSGDGEHPEMDAAAVTCFVAALDDARMPDDEGLRSALTDWFAWATTQMATYHRSPDDVPDGWRLPVWTWHGPAAR